ncbi:MAG: PatU [Elainella sp.]
MQDRFHALIKRRLRAEIERNPPLFPWESRLLDYEAEQTDWAASPSLWGTQLQALKLPVALPEALLQQIFAECRKLAHSSLKEGVKLVRAVETLFPDDLSALNQWAGQVLLEPARSAGSTLSPESLPQSYEQANPTQQMVLSLLTAQRLLEAMTLKLSVDQRQTQRQWQTAVGEVNLTADLQSDATGVRVQAQLPTAGRLRLNGESSRAAAACTGPDLLTVELGHLELGKTYALEVELEAADAPLVFAVVIEDDL